MVNKNVIIKFEQYIPEYIKYPKRSLIAYEMLRTIFNGKLHVQ